MWPKRWRKQDKRPPEQAPDDAQADPPSGGTAVPSHDDAPPLELTEEVAPETRAPVGPAADATASASAEREREPKAGGGGWMRRLRKGLSRSSNKLGGGIGAALTRRRLDEEALEELEELLISADLGVATAARMTQHIAKDRFNRNVDEAEVRGALAEDIAGVLEPVATPLRLDAGHRPHVILVVGVNGSGKTTTIGKLARQWVDEGRKVHLAAGDTFRAAAVEQLQVWGERTGCPVTARDTGADAAGLAYDALQQARRESADVLLIDTAGRLHNKANLMAELQKIVRVLKKLDAEAPHDVLLVLDATIGQNALQQVQTFKELVNVTGLVVTKLDGSARGGVLVALAEKFALPVHAIGVGESAEDLRPFSASAFARALVGLDPDG